MTQPDPQDVTDAARRYLLSVFGKELGLRNQAITAANESVDQFTEIYDDDARFALGVIYNHVASVVHSMQQDDEVPASYWEVGQALLTQAAVMLVNFDNREGT